MALSAALALALGALGCDSRSVAREDGAASKGDGPPLVTDTGTLADSAAPAPDAPSGKCSGASLVHVNGEVLRPGAVTNHRLVTACCREGTTLRFTASDNAGKPVEVHLSVQIGVVSTITDKPLPYTLSFDNPPQALLGMASLLYPGPGKTCEPNTSPCRSEGILTHEHDSFSGTITFSGSDWKQPLSATVCLEAKQRTPNNGKLTSLSLYARDVKVERWIQF